LVVIKKSLFYLPLQAVTLYFFQSSCWFPSRSCSQLSCI